MASSIICLTNNQKFNFLKYILDNLKKNLKASVPFYMVPRFVQIFVNHQIGDMSHHTGIYVNPSLTIKVFANMKRVGTWFSRVVTPLFDAMMVQAAKEVGDLPTTDQDTPILDAPSSSQPQRKHKPRIKEKKERKEIKVSPTELPIEEHVPPPSNDPLPSGEDSMPLKELNVLCTNLSNKVIDLENDAIEMKSSHKAKIAELESRVEKLEKENRSLTKELKSFNSKVVSPAFKEIVVHKEKSSKQDRKTADINADAEVNLKNVYNLDLAHEETILSMQDVTNADGKEVAEEMVEQMRSIQKIHCELIDDVNDLKTRGVIKTTSWNEFSSTMASSIICLTNNQKFNFLKYILDNLKKNLEASVPFYMFPRKHKPRIKEKKERKETKVSPIELPIEEHVPPPSNDPLSSEMKSSHKAKIAELESRVEKLEKENRSLTKEVKSFNSKVVSPAFKEIVVHKEKSSKQGRKTADINADAEVNLKNVYNLDLAHEKTILSMQDVTNADGKEVAEEMVEVIYTAKIIVDEVSTVGGKLNATNEEPISAAPTNITTAQPRVNNKNNFFKEVARRIEAEWNADMKDNIDWNEVVEQIQSRQSDAVRKYQALK
nr:hypothetical protein [Tanacetum cinerariifolium]